MSSPSAAATPDRPPRRLTLFGLATAALGFALMQTFLIPALPELRRDLGTSDAWVTWTITAYLLSGVVATPLLGRLGDQYGKAKLMRISLSVFLVGSLGALVAWDVGSLIAFRAVQGVGGAVFPLAYGVIRDEFPAQERSVAMGLISAVLGVGGGIGILMSGLVVDHLAWRWLFAVSAVIVALALWLVWKFVPESPVRAPATLDIPGALLLSGALASVLVALTEAVRLGWTSPWILGLFAASAAMALAWVRVEARSRAPMVDVHMLARRPVLFTNLTALISGFALYMTWVILPGFFQLPNGLPADLAPLADYGFGTSVTVAGLWILPTSAMILVSGPVAGWFGRRHGSRTPLVAGMLLLGIGCAGIALWHAAPWQVCLSFAVCGVGIGFSFAAMPRLVTDAVSPAETGIANGMNTVIRTVGGTVGAQVGAVILAAHTVGATSVPAESGFTIAFWISAIAGIVGAGAALLVAPRAGRRARAEAAAPELQTAAH